MSSISSSNAATSVSNGKFKLSSHVKYEHLVAGISGGVTSTLILHPLDLIKIRFAGKLNVIFLYYTCLHTYKNIHIRV